METTAEPTRHDTARISEEDQESTLAETTRLEAFSDGAFAIIITLLVLEIHRPNSATGHLAAELLKAWPSYLAYAVAFLMSELSGSIITICLNAFAKSI